MNNYKQYKELLLDSNIKHSAINFSNLSADTIEKAIQEGIKAENRSIAKIVENKDFPTFDNTILAFENSGELLNVASAVLFNLSSSNTSDEIDKVTENCASLLTKHNNDILMNEKLFEKIICVKEKASELLNNEQLTLLEKIYQDFERSGAALNKQDKIKFREITEELSIITVKYAQNNLRELNDFLLHITDKEKLAGLPSFHIEQAQLRAKEMDLEGWIFTLHAPSYIPFMTYADNRALRKEMYLAYNSLCTHKKNNNFIIVQRIVNLRRELAQLLGYKTYAEYVLKRRMAKSCKRVYELFNQLIDNYLYPAKKEIYELENFIKECNSLEFKLEAWDFAYYSEKLKLEKFNFDEEILRPYFELTNVIKGVFSLATNLYGITFKENNEIPTYHNDVKVFEVFDSDNKFLALLYCDFYTRKTKQNGAWMTNYKDQWKENGHDHRPHIAIVMNFTKPSENNPSLLNLSEIETFLHEFGHALHGIFSDSTFHSLSGTNVYWDFVELPSQFMENYAKKKEFLNTFAIHYKTGEILSDDLINKVIESRNFHAAYACIRQVAFGILDMGYYDLNIPFDSDIPTFEKEILSKISLLPHVPGTSISTHFSHIMNGGYAAGYYSYKWAELLDADAFAYFEEKGIFNKEIAKKFRQEILSKGGTDHPQTLYKNFRGKNPSIKYLLKRNGIIN